MAPGESLRRPELNFPVADDNVTVLGRSSVPVNQMWMQPDPAGASQSDTQNGNQAVDNNSIIFVDSSHPSSTSSTPDPLIPSEDGPVPTSSPEASSSRRRKRSYACPKCPHRFTSEYTLKVHLRAHKPKQPKALPCTMGCQEHFSRSTTGCGMR
ncbi:hypothetical protein EVJ58_g4991 [Rhodofomes roseus]|uniref:C2H2-type domain-containing protein n=1 Tax=Rhodofomes roseus TaxID=34475 RepID=A0A4Y9YGI3_9APHY|nr:hypothetical protein EVJ58_g4991 [Rhodofomes roseus]